MCIAAGMFQQCHVTLFKRPSGHDPCDAVQPFYGPHVQHVLEHASLLNVRFEPSCHHSLCAFFTTDLQRYVLLNLASSFNFATVKCVMSCVEFLTG